MNYIRAIKRGDDHSFQEVYYQYHQAIYHYIIKKTQSHYIAEEIVQITFFKLWKYRHSLKEEIPLLMQLFRIARTSLINELKKKQYTEDYHEHQRHFEEDNYSHVLEQVVYEDVQSHLHSLINKLPPVRKKVFELSRFKGMTYKEIAEMLSISPKTVENHINLALKYIKPFFALIIILSFFYQITIT